MFSDYNGALYHGFLSAILHPAQTWYNLHCFLKYKTISPFLLAFPQFLLASADTMEVLFGPSYESPT